MVLVELEFLMREYSGALTTGIAVQDGNYEAVDPSTKRQASIDELLSFARDYLKVKYIFWCTEEPYFSRDLVPQLREKR